MTIGMHDNYANDNAPPPKLNWFFRFLLWVAGADAKVLTTQCPEDIPKVLAQAGLLFGTFLYSCVVLTMIFNRLFGAEHFSFGLMFGAVGVSMLVSACDAYVFLQCSWIKDGIGTLKKMGWDIHLSPVEWSKTGLFLLNRLMLAFAWAYIVGLCLSLIIYAGDTHARIETAYLRANAAIVAQVSRPYDDEIKSEREAIANEESIVKALSKQATSLRQSQATAIARKSKPRRGEPAIEDSVREFESKLDIETTKLSAMKKHLADLVEGRNPAIRKAVDSAPNHVPYSDGFLGEVKALEEITSESGKIAFIVWGIEVIAVGIEMAAVLAKLLGFNPTTYSTIMARTYYARLEQIADEMEQGLDDSAEGVPDPLSETPLNDNNLFTGLETPANDNVPSGQTVKRGPGRPRGSKNRRRVTNGTGQEVPKAQRGPEE